MSGQSSNKSINIKGRATSSSRSRRPDRRERRVKLEMIEIVRIRRINEVEATGIKIQIHVGMPKGDGGRKPISKFLYSPNRK